MTGPDATDQLREYVADELERVRIRSLGLTTALLDESDTRLSDHELDRLAQLIDRARRTGV